MLGVDDVVETEVAAAAAATVIAASRPARRVLRKGAVYGLAGVLMLGDGVAAFARGVGRGVRAGRETRSGEARLQPAGAEGGA